MSKNTFKQYMSVFIIFNDELDKVIQEKESVVRNLNKLKINQDDLGKNLELVSERLDRVIQERDKIKQQLHKTVKGETEFKAKLDKVIHRDLPFPSGAQGSENAPKRIKGWSIQKSKDGYYRCYRKIKKKVHSIYIGKTFDTEKAKTRIKAKEKNLEQIKNTIV